MNDHPTFLDLLRNAERIVADDKAWQRRNTVPQQPWPDDGTLPVAAHVVLYVDSETGEQSILWTGQAYGVTATCETRGVAGPLRVRPSLEIHDGNPVLYVRLVDDAGCTRACTMDWAGWWTS